ncbi:MAG: Fic family protein [Lentisphaeria bacterium]|nr:Fic family protein [Lentisphaeria bacterium]
MTYKPPFSLNTDILNLVAKISEILGSLQSYSDQSPLLRKKNRIKTIQGTLAIEGNTLTEEQITAYLEGKHVMGSVKELSEVQGAIKAYDSLSSFNSAKVEDLLTAHSYMMEGTLKGSGKFRKVAVGVQAKEGIVHMAPPAERLPFLINDLCHWINTTNEHPLIKSCVFHYEFEFIHPFTDGNGRMGRLWQTLILSEWNPIFSNLPLENMIQAHQHEYYQALKKSDTEGESTFFLSFILKLILATVSENASINAPVNAPIKTPDAVYQCIRDNPSITRKEMAQKLGKDIRTIGRAIQKLKEQGKILYVGSPKSGHWQIL